MFTRDAHFGSQTLENSVLISRFDPEHPLSSCSPHPIELEGQAWPSCEHYLAASIAAQASLKQNILAAPTGLAAAKLIKPWYRRKIKGWKQRRRVLMSRALYTKICMYSEVRAALDETEDKWIVETSLYDHYWGIGRDQRGENMFGKVWMAIRSKLTEENT